MDFTSSLIGPEQAPATAPQAPADVPLDQIAELPPVRALLEGNPPAIYAEEGINTPLTQTIGRNIKKVNELGLALYRSPNKKLVLFNPSILDPEALKEADAAGKLDAVATPLEAFEGGGVQKAAQPAANAPAPNPGPANGLTPRAQSKLAGTRIKNLMDGETPSRRAIPGGGRIINDLLARAV